MNTSQLSKSTGVSAYRLRHYEQIGLIQAQRSPSGYRIFSSQTEREVRFVAKCREVGVSLKQIGEVLPAYRAGTLTFDEMIELMGGQIEQVDKQISDLRILRHELEMASDWFKRKKREQTQRIGAKRTSSSSRK